MYEKHDYTFFNQIINCKIYGLILLELTFFTFIIKDMEVTCYLFICVLRKI